MILSFWPITYILNIFHKLPKCEIGALKTVHYYYFKYYSLYSGTKYYFTCAFPAMNIPQK